MVQILNPNPSTQTLRAQAMEQGFNQFQQGIGGIADAYQKAQDTQRQQALEGLKIKIGAGYDLTPEETSYVDTMLKPNTESTGAFSKLFGPGKPEQKEIHGDKTDPYAVTGYEDIAAPSVPQGGISNAVNQQNSQQDIQPKNNLSWQRTPEYLNKQSKMNNDLAESNYKAAQLKLPYSERDSYKEKMDSRSIINEQRNYDRQQKQNEKEEQLTTPYGLAHSVDDAKKLKEAHESKKNFDEKLNEMISLREKHGGGALLNRDDVGRANALSKDLLLEYKNMAKLGVLSQSDENIINAIIPSDPLEYNSPVAAIQGQDPVLHKLKSFKNDSDKDFATRVSTRTRGQSGFANQSEGLHPAVKTMTREEKLKILQGQ